MAAGWEGDVVRLAVFVAFALLVARPAAVFLSFATVDLPRPQELFVAWLRAERRRIDALRPFVVNSQVPNRTLIFDVAAVVVVCSIVAHGVSDTLCAAGSSAASRPGTRTVTCQRPARRGLPARA